jgi:hypothetical protein
LEMTRPVGVGLAAAILIAPPNRKLRQAITGVNKIPSGRVLLGLFERG